MESRSASVVQPAAARQSAPRAVRQSSIASTAMNPATKRWRHHVGVPVSPTRRAVSAGMLWVATSCCCSPTAFRNPSACEPNPTSASAPSASRLAAALASAARRSRRGAARTRNGSSSPAVTLIPTPATSVAAAALKRGLAPAVSASAAASTSSISVSLWAPPTASTSSTGFRPTKAAAQRREDPRRPAARAISATAARLDATAMPLKAHRAPAMPSGATA